MVQTVNLDSQNFFKCIESSKTKQLVKEMAEVGAKADIPGTPAFFINGKMLSGTSNNLISFLNYIYDYID